MPSPPITIGRKPEHTILFPSGRILHRHGGGSAGKDIVEPCLSRRTARGVAFCSAYFPPTDHVQAKAVMGVMWKYRRNGGDSEPLMDSGEVCVYRELGWEWTADSGKGVAVGATGWKETA